MIRILQPSPVQWRGVGTTPWRSAPDCRRPSRKKKQSMRLDGISRMHILFLVLGQHLISLDQVKGKILAKIDIFCFTRS